MSITRQDALRLASNGARGNRLDLEDLLRELINNTGFDDSSPGAFSAVDADDTITVLDKSDTSASTDGTNKEVAAKLFLDGGPGNVLLHGADPLGVLDSQPPFQASVDSAWPFYCPPGLFRLNTEVAVLTPKIMEFSGGHYTRDQVNEDVLSNLTRIEGQARVFSENDINLFNLQCEEVHIRGGMFQLRHPTATGACFYLPVVNNGDLAGGPVGDYGGWGGSIKGSLLCGLLSTLEQPNGGGTGIFIDFENQDVIWAYITGRQFDVECRSLRYGIRDNAKAAGMNQWANTLDVRIHGQAVKTMLHLESINAADIWLRHQGKHMFSTIEEADAHPSIYLRGNSHRIFKNDFADFGKPTSKGFETNSKTYDIISNDFENYDRYQFGKEINYEGEMLGPEVRSAIGVSPRLLSQQSDRSIFIPELHDQLLQKGLGATVTAVAYKGTDVVVTDVETDFLALDEDSVTAGITPSAEITLANWDNLFLYEGVNGSPSMAWSQTGIDDNDYVELHVDSAQSTQLSKLWIIMNNTDGRHVSHIQVMRGVNGNMVDNEIIAVNDLGEMRNTLRTFEFTLGGNALQDIIIRFIGASSLDTNGVAGIYADHTWFQQPTPAVTIHGNKEFRNTMGFNGGGWDEAHVTLGDHHLWVDSTGDLRIKNGAPTSDLDGTVVGAQT